MTTFKEHINEATEDFYISNHKTISNKQYNRVRVLAKPCKIFLYHYNKLIDTFDYQHSVSHYIESLKDFKRKKVNGAEKC